MGCYDFAYATKRDIATKGYILIPEHATHFFGATKLKVVDYMGYGRFKTETGKLLDIYVTQGIILELEQKKEVDLTLEDLFFDKYDYMSDLEKYRLLAIDELVHKETYSQGKGFTTAKFPIKIVHTLKPEYDSYETCPYASASGQFASGYKREIPFPFKVLK